MLTFFHLLAGWLVCKLGYTKTPEQIFMEHGQGIGLSLEKTPLSFGADLDKVKVNPEM